MDTMLSYKEKPLARKDNIIYYGSMAEKYIVMLQVTASKEVDGVPVPTSVNVSLQLTDPEVKAKERILKKTDVGGLYEALDIGSIWLERALKQG